jgi:hypothetical protein
MADTKLTDQEQIAAIKERPGVNGRSEFPPGWVALIAECDRRLLETDPDYRVEQIKEKFGGLRYYTSSSDGDWRELAKVTDFFERMSLYVCDTCGTTLDVSTEGTWVRTMCKSCREAAMAARG